MQAVPPLWPEGLPKQEPPRLPRAGPGQPEAWRALSPSVPDIGPSGTWEGGVLSALTQMVVLDQETLPVSLVLTLTLTRGSSVRSWGLSEPALRTGMDRRLLFSNPHLEKVVAYSAGYKGACLKVARSLQPPPGGKCLSPVSN